MRPKAMIYPKFRNMTECAFSSKLFCTGLPYFYFKTVLLAENTNNRFFPKRYNKIKRKIILKEMLTRFEVE
jgi:hypothetical protein